MLMF